MDLRVDRGDENAVENCQNKHALKCLAEALVTECREDAKDYQPQKKRVNTWADPKAGISSIFGVRSQQIAQAKLSHQSDSLKSVGPAALSASQYRVQRSSFAALQAHPNRQRQCLVVAVRGIIERRG